MAEKLMEKKTDEGSQNSLNLSVKCEPINQIARTLWSHTKKLRMPKEGLALHFLQFTPA